MDDYTDFMAAMSSLNNTLLNNANIYLAAQTSTQDRKFSREMSDLAYQRNLELWNMQNDYNLPANIYRRQLEGLEANGLNPNLVYGSSSAASVPAGSPSPYKFDSYHSTAVPQFGRDNGVNQFLNTRLLQTQVAAQEANNRLINARAANEEARNPGVAAKSNEAAYRWNKINNSLLGNLDEAIQASIAKEYWTGVKANYEADITHYKRDMAFYEAAMAEWLNTAEVPGMGMTYRQYMEMYKAYLPGAQYAKFKADVLNIASEIAYRKQQGQMLDLKMEYQRALNRLAWYGRGLGNDWVTLLLSGIFEIFGVEPSEAAKSLAEGIGQSQLDIPPTYPGP